MNEELEEIDESLELTEEAGDELYVHHQLKVDKGQTQLRIDKFLSNRLLHVSRNKIQQAADAELIKVNGKSVKSNYKVRPLDEITLLLPHPKASYDTTPEDIPLDILYEDDDIVMVNKPAGLVVHPGSGNYHGTLINALSFHFQNLPNATGTENRPGLVHRIDKNTSGILVIAKTDQAMTVMAKQFFDHTIERKYIALVWGLFDEKEGVITGNIGRHEKYRMMRDVFPEGDQGKHAVTHYKVLEEFNYTSLIECQLETGRTHQIRVHMQHIGHPIFSDDVYGGDKIVKGTIYNRYRQFVENCFSILPRQALHAKSLGFTHPRTGRKMFFDSKLPDDFEAVLTKWRTYSTFKKE